MKRTIALLLLCTMLLSLMLPTSFAAETDEIPLDALSEALKYAQEHPSDALTEPTVSEAVQNESAKRLKQDDNLIYPAPLMDDLAACPNSNMPITAILMQTGKAEQYHCTAVYRGEKVEGTPVASKIGAFGTEIGLYEYEQYWNTNGMTVGTYTVVFFTAQKVGDSLEPVEDSASAVEVSLRWYVSDVQKLSFADWDTGDTLETVNMGVGDIAYLAIKRSPVPCYNGGDLSVSCTGSFHVEEYNGLMIVQSTGCGWGKLSVRNESYVTAEIELSACLDPQGHHEDTPIVAREASADVEGMIIHTCTLCGSVKRETVPAYLSYFRLFVDVPETEWYYTPVKEAVGKNLFRGVSTHHFGPETKMTRAMLVTVLWRYEGSPEVGGTPFTDVRATDWYATQVAWAAQNGVVNGVGNGKFDPEGEVTREQMAAILYRYAQKKALDTTARGDLGGFADQSKVSAWAKDALSWTVAAGIIGGSKDGGKLLLNPLNGATRAEVAAILVRFIDNIADPIPPVETVDMGGAEESGTFEARYPDTKLQWAFFKDGTLVISGTGFVPAAQPNGEDGLWGEYSERIRTVKVLYGVEMLEEACFQRYAALETVELSGSVQHISANAFDGCVKLQNVTLPDTLRYIDGMAFANCTSLTELTLPHDLITLGTRAFYGCTSLKHMELPDAIIGESMMDYYKRGIGEEIFMNCTALETVKLPLALEHVPSGCFFGCTSLEQVEISFVTYSIRDGAFHGCSALEEIVLSESISVVSPMAFNACTNLKKITVLNPYLYYNWYNAFPAYYEGGEWPFGDPAQVTVCGYAGSTAQELAEEYGYTFEALPE